MNSCGYRSSQRAERQLDAALDPAQDLVGLERIGAAARHEVLAGRARQRLACTLEPARGGRAVDALDRRDLIDRERVDQVHPEAQALPRCARLDRGAKRILEALRIALHVGAVEVRTGRG